MNLSELQTLLNRFDLTPSRKLGQSFLVDDNISQWIASQLHVGPDDCVIEVGAGFGALTEHIAGKCRRFILVEKDGRLAEYLAEKYGPLGVEVVHADATEYDVRPLFREGGVKFIGNLPYSCGNEILRRFLDAPSPISEAIIMVQKEVASRFTAEPRSKDYGILSLMLQERWEATHLKTIGPGPFHPRPAVDSSIVRFDRRASDSLPLHSPEVFASTVKQGFSQRRKQLPNNLTVEKERAAEVLESMGLKTSVRAEELALAEWVTLSNHLDPHPCSALPPSATELLDVVNEKDEVIDQVTRREVHEKKFLHRAVHVFLQNKQGEIYLQLRSLLKDTHGGKWDSSASGHVDPGESYLACAKREMWEEVWVQPKGDIVRVARLDASDATDQEFIEVFLAEPKGKIRVHGKEVDSGCYFPVDQIEQWIEERPQDFATGFVTCFKAWRAN
ncbi:MAG: 16S rRNA (adenine(1518)-N(6)/adenine(1519)-N(6))-dimethyltransferase RsmA [Verrucomicrobiales bacterium]|nr:16S rRNA (adenine(1518)-N(6)/adenine(1519)-N(6))-dimethyltransferase RsmA [Verrucomicrobiales bacterium]